MNVCTKLASLWFSLVQNGLQYKRIEDLSKETLYFSYSGTEKILNEQVRAPMN